MAYEQLSLVLSGRERDDSAAAVVRANTAAESTVSRKAPPGRPGRAQRRASRSSSNTSPLDAAAVSGAGIAAAHLARSTDPRTSHDAAERMVQSGRIRAQREAAVFLVELYDGMTARELAFLSLPHHDCTSLGRDPTERYHALARRLPECPEVEPRDTGSRARVWHMREAT